MRNILHRVALDEFIEILRDNEIPLPNGDTFSIRYTLNIGRGDVMQLATLSKAFREWCEMKGYNIV